LTAALGMAGARKKDIVSAISTGYGRKNVTYARDTKTEIGCHAKGCFHYFPFSTTVIDIGGQDNKIIKIDDKGLRTGFKMNRKCAAGTGAFLEEMAMRLDTALEDMDDLAHQSENMVKLGSFCTVFSATEVLENIRQGKKLPDIVKGVFFSMIKRVLEMDSLTEKVVMTGGVVAHTAEEALRKPGTVGRPVPGGHVRIYDDDGNVLGPSEVGDVYLKIDGYPDFTYNGLDEKRQEIERDGMVTAGDVGYVDEDGYLFLCDRKKDMVISGGVNIYPAEIEGVLIDMPGVKDCAVFGIPDEEFGEALCAYIEPEPGATPGDDEVRTYLLERLAKYKLPRVIELIGALPREDSGKIFKRKLRAPYWERAGRQI